MKLTRMADYASVLMTQLAEVGPGCSLSASQLARSTGLKLPTVSKLLKQLTVAQLVCSKRGKKGGYSLAREASAISLIDILNAMEDSLTLTECVDDSPNRCSFEYSCPIRGHWNPINHSIRQVLVGVSVDDLRLSRYTPPIKGLTP